MDWSKCYRDEHTPWEKGAAAPPLLEWIEDNPGVISGRVLVPGCGLGHDCRALAAHTKASEIRGIDIAPEAIERARTFSVAGNEAFEVADLFSLDQETDGAWDWVWEHTCFCAIQPDRRDDYVEAVRRVLRPEGILLAVFFLDPYDEDHQPGGGPPHGTSLEELHSRFVASGAFEEIEGYVPTQSYEGREGLERVVRYRRLP